MHRHVQCLCQLTNIQLRFHPPGARLTLGLGAALAVARVAHWVV